MMARFSFPDLSGQDVPDGPPPDFTPFRSAKPGASTLEVPPDDWKPLYPSSPAATLEPLPVRNLGLKALSAQARGERSTDWTTGNAPDPGLATDVSENRSQTKETSRPEGIRPGVAAFSLNGNATPAPAAPKSAPGQAKAPPPPEKGLEPAEVEKIKAQAREAGYREGLVRAEAEKLAALQEQARHFEAMLTSLERAREDLLRRVRDDLVKILTLTTRKITRTVLEVDSHAIVHLVEGVLSELPQQEHITVRVSPADLEKLEAALPELKKQVGRMSRLELEGSPQITDGAVVITDAGNVDATVDRQLEIFEQRLRDWLLGEEPSASAAAPLSGRYASLARKGR